MCVGFLVVAAVVDAKVWIVDVDKYTVSLWLDDPDVEIFHPRDVS